MFNWDDVRVFIAVVQSGSFSAAGRRIGMDATTVARRMQRLETGLKATLIVRGRVGLQLTAAGVRLAEAGASVEAAMKGAGEEGSVDPLAGTVRISVAEGFGGCVLGPALPTFMARHPGMRIELDASPGYLSPTTRKVDIAITSSRLESSRLVVERLTDYELGLYAAPKYLEERGVPQTREDLRQHDFVGCVDDLVYSEQLRFLDAFEPKLRCRLKCSSMKVQIILAASGGGIGAFPHYLVEGEPDLTPVLPDLSLTRTYWEATHKELYEIARARAVRDWLYDLVEERKRHFTPSRFRVVASAVPANG